MNGHVLGVGRGYGRGYGCDYDHGHGHDHHVRHVCNLHDHDNDDLYVLDAIRRMFFHILPLSRNYLHSYYIHRSLRVHICRFDGYDTNVEFQQNSLRHPLPIHIWAERMDVSYLFEKKNKNLIILKTLISFLFFNINFVHFFFQFNK